MAFDSPINKLLCYLGFSGALLANSAPVLAAPPVSDAEKLFALKVKPILTDKCFSCHGSDPDKIKGELILLTREQMLKGGEYSDKILVPGNAEESDLYIAVTWQDEDLEMPPKENDRLTEEQTWFIRDWINGGAPWPDEKRVTQIVEEFAEGMVVQTSGGLSEDWTNRRYEKENLWAYQPITKPVAFSESDAIDAFINQSQANSGIAPAPSADRRTLIRRATYDLIGLPPSPAEIGAFLNDTDTTDIAFEKVVDRLLASPHYGERWGRHWLDVVRYADSSGFANDYERGSTWRYRDYVIRAFNEDKPYDQFVREQIAGDELYEVQPEDKRDPELLIAAGFLRMGPWELTGMEVAKIARQRFLDDVTDATGQVFLGHMMQCARCHDHKFDPIPTRDYYSMQAIFSTTQIVDREAAFLEEENISGFDEKEYLEKRRTEFDANLKRLGEKETKAGKAWAAQHGYDYVQRYEGLKRGIPEDQLPPKKVGFSVEDYGMERISRKGKQRIGWQMDRYEPVAFSVYSGATVKRSNVQEPVRMPKNRKEGEMERSAILTGGDPFSPSLPVTPGVISAVFGFNKGTTLDVTEEVSGRRTELANWICSDNNPLTARVMVNRIWQWHFGQPIAGNPNNFGATGKKPTHPELLDWLAATFTENGWSVKKMHKLIMMSGAYRRAGTHPDKKTLSETDPNGTSYAVFKPRRLSAEELRDSMLSVSGELNRTMGGIPNRPEINLEAALQPRMVMGTFAEAWQPNPLPEQRHRRSIYALKIRGLGDPFMEVFNQPSPDLSCEAREASTVTPQVFSLFNSEISMDRAVAFAIRLENTSGSKIETIKEAFKLAYGRSPTTEETELCRTHWETMTVRHTKLNLPERNNVTEVIRDAVEENTGEKFSFVETLEFYKDFVPDKKLTDIDPETRGLAELCLVLFNSNEFAYVY